MGSDQIGFTQKIAQFIVNTKENDISPSIYEHAKLAFMDWFAVTIAGKDELLVMKLIQYADLLGGIEQASILGHNMKRNVNQAALINGSASHALDYDDSHQIFMGHPSVAIFPALLAYAEWQAKSGAEFLIAYLVGFKVGACIGRCAGQRYYRRGWHSTSTLGRLASAAACARIMRLNETRTLYAMGIAGTQSAGLKQVVGTMCKPLHAGTASQGGLMAAMLAQEDFTSVPNIFEGSQGFFKAFGGQVVEGAVRSLGKTWEIDKLAQKYYPSCYFTHSPIEAVLRIQKKESLAWENVKNVRISVSQSAVDTAGKSDPRTGLESKFSIRYCVAHALLKGNAGITAFTDKMVSDYELRDVMEKVRVKLSPHSDFRKRYEAEAEVELNSGKTYKEIVDVYNENPGLGIRKEKVIEKFRFVCRPVFGNKKTEGLIELILSLEKLDEVKDFVKETWG